MHDDAPCLERLRRLERWQPSESYALAADKSLAAVMPSILPLLAFVDSLYPPGELIRSTRRARQASRNWLSALIRNGWISSATRARRCAN